MLGSHSHDLHYKVMTDRGRQPVFWTPDAISTVQTASTRRALLDLIPADDRLSADPEHRQVSDPILTDLRLSRRLLEHHTGTPCRWLAWPYGFGHSALDRQAEAAGFAGTLSLRPRSVDSESAPWHVGRFTLTAKTTLQDIAVLLAAAEEN